MAGSRGRRPRGDAQEDRSASGCQEKAVQEGSHPAGGPRHLYVPAGSGGLDSKSGALEAAGPPRWVASLERGKTVRGNPLRLAEQRGLEDPGLKRKGWDCMWETRSSLGFFSFRVTERDR